MSRWKSISRRENCLTCGSEGTQYIDIKITGREEVENPDGFICDNKECEQPLSPTERDYYGIEVTK